MKTVTLSHKMPHTRCLASPWGIQWRHRSDRWNLRNTDGLTIVFIKNLFYIHNNWIKVVPYSCHLYTWAITWFLLTDATGNWRPPKPNGCASSLCFCLASFKRLISAAGNMNINSNIRCCCICNFIEERQTMDLCKNQILIKKGLKAWNRITNHVTRKIPEGAIWSKVWHIYNLYVSLTH